MLPSGPDLLEERDDSMDLRVKKWYAKLVGGVMFEFCVMGACDEDIQS